MLTMMMILTEPVLALLLKMTMIVMKMVIMATEDMTTIAIAIVLVMNIVMVGLVMVIMRAGGDRADVKDDGIHGKFIRDSNFDNEDKNASTLLIDSIVPGKSIKLATKETNFTLPVHTGLDDRLRSQFPTTSYPQGLRPWVNEAEFIDNLYNTRIPSLEATGINQKFLARHTTDQSLQHASHTGDSNLLTPRAEWPMWSLPPPDASETGHRWRHSSGLHPSAVRSQTGGQSSWQFRNQPSREMNSSNFNPQEQKSFNHIDPWFASGAEAFTGLRMSDSPPATNDTTSGSVFKTHATIASAYESKLRYSANNSYGSHVNSFICGGLPVRDRPPVSRLPTVKSHAPVVCPSVTTPVTVLQPTASITSQSLPSYSYQSTVLPENGQECFMEPSIPNSFTENQENVCPIISSASRREEQRSGTKASSPEFPDDPSLAALERKVAEACAVVARVMKEREERAKTQREAARKKREMREQREREAKEMRERERREREERERQDREIRERQEREMREKQEREMRERQEKERGDQTENEDRDKRWFGGEQAPVQESPRWQCEHYQRRCLVKFPCCGIFYPCHRCHNTSGACDTDDRKANNATHVKCGICGHDEEINEGSQHCSSCGEQMSAYFCFICKHFTGVEKNPFHCDKCGICRIHKDKSFHCDVCNVCLDKRLEGKHKCRPDSGHDECCICLEDAFSGCQILPCSHKVHKECAIAMIQNGICTVKPTNFSNGNENDSQDDSKDESEDGNYVSNCNECRDAECHISDANELEDRQADFNANSDAEGSNHDDDNDGDNGDQTDGGTTVKNAVDRARAKTLPTSNENTVNVSTTSHSSSLRPKTSSPRLPRGNRVELDYFYNSRIPSLDATGINKDFLARHTTDQSLQHYDSQSGDFSVPRKSTSCTDWPVWSLPPPHTTETNDLRHQWSQSNRLHPSAFARQRLPESYLATNGTISGSSFNTHAAMGSAYEPKEHYTANNIYGSHVNSSTYGGFPVRNEPPALRLPTAKPHAPMVCPSVTKPVTEMQPTTSMTSQSVTSYSYQSTVLPEKGQEPFMEPSIPNSFTENQEHVRPITSYTSRREDQRSGTEATSPEFPDDPSLAALERKREAARKRREMREQRETEAKEMREREERERKEKEEREREDRKMRERQETEIREREETEMRERQERERREQIENEDRDTRWFGGERAPVQESPRWQCEHYQRRCLVKFPCCGIFYPCHRCHNTSGACDTDDRKANNATHVKCGICGHEEEINEGSQNCSGCGEQMSAYFCFICKHFTGVEKNPFHCDKCGICRIHKDKSFHCDVCNVCLDKRLEGKHKCRPDSGHDECCICLEDAFSGCQILPCSHKVHKECAIAMIQNGVRNCPICRHPLFSQDSQ
ncbi:unnamed protein product [Porites lobata]|uniref:RING finger and CHY zinc finger domain-containing protein 1 n=1 Tax=Porites lobata TaxID=104759 RepID=A0ABN8NJF0_9CNID|nr:unnamed protein product [Porites lobata]